MRFNFISIIYVSGSMLSGCGNGGGGGRDRKGSPNVVAIANEFVNPSKFGKLATDSKLIINDESKAEPLLEDDVSKLNYFGYKVSSVTPIGDFNGVRLFRGPDLATYSLLA
jgi:hypothetical protein